MDPSEVLTASTGVIGHRMPLKKVLDGVPVVLGQLTESPTAFAESLMTTDKVQKVFVREVFIAGTLVQLHAVAKGAGMISPALATTLCFVTTDAQITAPALRRALDQAVARTLNQLTVDGETSTNDTVVALANGAAGNVLIELGQENQGYFEEALHELLVDVTRAIARDGEGSTRTIEVDVVGAASLAEARQLSLAVADSLLVKSSVFGADPYAWGRILAALGARAGKIRAAFHVGTLSLELQGVRVFDNGRPVHDAPGLARLKFAMQVPVV